MSLILSPSLLSADFAALGAQIDMLNDSQADWIHVDVMDGVFVPNISFAFPVMETLKKRSYKPLDVHLMIVEPDRYITRFKEGMKAAVTLNPHTPVSQLEDIITEADMVLLMSVNPGFAAQKFIENTYEKIARLKELILRKNASTLIEVDGGVNLENAPKLKAAGADALVAGNAIFSAENPQEIIQRFKEI